MNELEHIEDILVFVGIAIAQIGIIITAYLIHIR